MADTIRPILESGEVSLRIPQISSLTYTIRGIKTSPCQLACPIDTKVKSYLGLIAAGEFDRAVAVVKRDNPFPGICGRVCIHPCENECERVKIDQPLAICSLKRFLADHEFNNSRITAGPVLEKKKEKVAIVGAGPAGLTAANDLARLGYQVTVFEALPESGGLLLHGIPAFRLPKEIVRFETAGIKELGVRIKTKVRIGQDIPLKKLKKDYHAVLLSIGAHKSLLPGIPGARNLKGMVDLIAFVKKINKGRKIKTGESFVVIGGDRVALDTARAALRAGYDQSTVIFSRSRNEMPAQDAYIDDALEEGVKIYYRTQPVQVLGEKGKVVGLECVKTEMDRPDRLGRRIPIPIEDSNFNIKTDTVTSSMNREPDMEGLGSKKAIKTSLLNTLIVNPDTLYTGQKGLFAAGDCVTGPKTTIEAIAAGRRAARSIDRYIKGETLQGESDVEKVVEYEVVLDQRDREERQDISRLPLSERHTFKEVELGFNQKRAMEEAKRCLRCGPCNECNLCVTECIKRLAVLTAPGDKEGTLVRIQHNPAWLSMNGHPLQGRLLGAHDQEQPVVMEVLNARIDPELCRGCGDCVNICMYGAPDLQDMGNGVHISKIDKVLCRGCGVCPSICPSSAIRLNYFSDAQINRLSA